MDKIVVEMTFKKDTKGTQVLEAADAAITSLYVSKSAMPTSPKRVRVTLEVLE